MFPNELWVKICSYAHQDLVYLSEVNRKFYWNARDAYKELFQNINALSPKKTQKEGAYFQSVKLQLSELIQEAKNWRVDTSLYVHKDNPHSTFVNLVRNWISIRKSIRIKKQQVAFKDLLSFSVFLSFDEAEKTKLLNFFSSLQNGPEISSPDKHEKIVDFILIFFERVNKNTDLKRNVMTFLHPFAEGPLQAYRAIQILDKFYFFKKGDVINQLHSISQKLHIVEAICKTMALQMYLRLRFGESTSLGSQFFYQTTLKRKGMNLLSLVEKKDDNGVEKIDEQDLVREINRNYLRYLPWDLLEKIAGIPLDPTQKEKELTRWFLKNQK